MEDFKTFVERRLATDEPEPFCPFYHTPIGYCNLAYSDRCYTCEEAKGEWEALHSGED